MGPHEILKLLHNKRNGSKLERPHTDLEKILTSYTLDNKITRIYRELKKLHSPTINEPIKNWATELNKSFSKGEVQLAKKTHKKLFTFPGHEGNTNLNHNEIPPHSC
jgi:hypothetical protein